MSGPFDGLDDAARARLRRRRAPRWTAPMLAELTHEVPGGAGWVYERKLDGVRCLVFRHGGRVRLLSRNRKPLNAAFPELVERARQERCRDFVADGEIVAFEGRRTSFARLQQRLGREDPDAARASRVAAYLYLFDLVHLDGRDLSGLALRDRKRLLKQALGFGGRLRFTPHRRGDGAARLDEACGKGWEGLIAKRESARYRHSRSRDWRKLKCVNRQELVVGGWTEPRGSRHGLGALLVGHYDGDGRLRYAGRVGTGFDAETLDRLAGRLERLERDSSPFEPAPRARGAHWVTPRLVAEVAFTEWTRDGRLRHSRYLGLRSDKSPRDVRRERPASEPG